MELFRLVINEEGNITIKFGREVKSSLSVEELENLLKEDIQTHLTPIVTKLVQAIS
ncbi:hypothetical protein GKZ28_08515 [Clostridium chromiireducens]|jgi:hypothetical protein|uniref:Uncharacterized protein n=1 Tax=Clostridium chromiireducens TaxID=225345 RepID=A0A964RLF8_9CLOT|nr:hypothetical protein [Clostridium chromiireducens]MVX63737.1 hypothetical protein [Clostridium chromiireducens]